MAWKAVPQAQARFVYPWAPPENLCGLATPGATGRLAPRIALHGGRGCPMGTAGSPTAAILTDTHLPVSETMDSGDPCANCTDKPMPRLPGPGINQGTLDFQACRASGCNRGRPAPWGATAAVVPGGYRTSIRDQPDRARGPPVPGGHSPLCANTAPGNDHKPAHPLRIGCIGMADRKHQHFRNFVGDAARESRVSGLPHAGQ